MKKEEYVPRIAEANLLKNLKSIGCVLVNGPKFCGKSTMCEFFAKSVFSLKKTNEIELAKADPAHALKGERPHLIDEWQKAPEIWNYIRDDLDKDYQFGKYIITGSTTPIDASVLQHTGAGRIASMMLRPFSLFESKESLGLISLSSLFDSNYIFETVFPSQNPVSLYDIAYYICRGGWPIAVKAEKEYALEVTRKYYDGLFALEDISDEFSDFLKNKDIELLILILKSYARNISTQARIPKMINDILASGVRTKLDENTFVKYEKVLKQLFIIYDLPAWNLNLRSTVVVRSAPTHHFVDTSIATAALGINPNDLLNDMHSFGYFFEDFALRDLTIYAESFGATIKHYRDSSGQEVDAIVELPNSNYAAIEIKIASDKNICEACKSLNRFEAKMKNNDLKTPIFKMVLVSHGAAYKTKDGIYIVPITLLKN